MADLDKQRARTALTNAVSRGQVRRPSRCSECGAVGKVHGHHNDYSKPLDVDWPCVRCHENRHHNVV